VQLYGCRTKSVSVGLGYSLGWTPALSLTHSVAETVMRLAFIICSSYTHSQLYKIHVVSQSTCIVCYSCAIQYRFCVTCNREKDFRCTGHLLLLRFWLVHLSCIVLILRICLLQLLIVAGQVPVALWPATVLPIAMVLGEVCLLDRRKVVGVMLELTEPGDARTTGVSSWCLGRSV